MLLALRLGEHFFIYPTRLMTSRRYVAFLRAINVGGRVVKMTVLKKVFEGLKLAEG